MRGVSIIWLCLFFCISYSGLCQQSDAPLSLLVKPGISIPVGEDADIYKPGWGGTISLSYNLFPFLNLGLHSGYSYFPVDTLPDFKPKSLTITHLGMQAGTSLELLPQFSLSAYAGGGWYYGMNNEDTQQTEDNPYVHGGLGLSYQLIPSFSIGVEGAYRNFSGLAKDIMVHLGGTLHLGGRKDGPSGIPSNRNLELLDVQLQRVFPVFYGYYDEHPLGMIVISNKGNVPLEQLRVSFFVKQFMDNPKLCYETSSLCADEELQVPIYALFNDAVLEITEGTKVSARILVESESDGRVYANEYVETLGLYDRNAMTWEDTAKAASFVTAKNPEVLRFSKNVSGMVKERVSKSLNQNIVLALSLFQALDLYGIRYEIDPSSAYEDLSKQAMMVDYLQFPRQTLDFRAGDCDDLSILYSALLESIGIETAFITVPGHIYMAFSTGMSSKEARGFFNNQNEVLFIDDAAWIPVEITAIEKGFVRAWKIGAEEWKQHYEQGRTEFIPIRSSWKTYNAVGYASGGALGVAAPPADRLVAAVLREVDRLVENEIFQREQQLKKEIMRTEGHPRSLNKLGVLYARYGLINQARVQFERSLEIQEYLPSLVNLGMLEFLNEEYQKSYRYYRRAQVLRENHTTVLLGLARVQHELRNYKKASVAYQKLKNAAPSLAKRYAYLDFGGKAVEGRAVDASSGRLHPVWEEEE